MAGIAQIMTARIYNKQGRNYKTVDLPRQLPLPRKGDHIDIDGSYGEVTRIFFQYLKVKNKNTLFSININVQEL